MSQQHWMLYLMSGEDRAREAIKQYEHNADTVINHLRDVHMEEYEEFQANWGTVKATVAAKCELTRDALGAAVKDPADFQMMQIQLGQKHEGRMTSVHELKRKWERKA
jgi:hypothetical protein